MTENVYLVIDVGTGNVRVALVTPAGKVVAIAADVVRYHRDTRYTDALYFEPEALWAQILELCRRVMAGIDGARVAAITSSSQREGVVLLDASGREVAGMPNIDHRGRDFEDILADKDRVYRLTGRYPTSLFSAFKVLGIARREPERAAQISVMVSISEWVLFRLSGKTCYEHAQASETLLYDVENRRWSEELCADFAIDPAILPPLAYAGDVLGDVLPEWAGRFGISPGTKVVVGGADTQLAILSTLPSTDDVVIVSGTTTPVVKIVDQYITDDRQRTWTNSHALKQLFILETNAGVTGLNLQRFKAIFYPNEPYEQMEREILAAIDKGPQCWAALGSLIADEKRPLIRGGFVLPTPLHHELTRGDFAFALLWDLACSIYENYRNLCDVVPHREPYLWACGGGMQSTLLLRFLAGLTGKEIRVRTHFTQSTVAGGAVICNSVLQLAEEMDASFEATLPDGEWDTTGWYNRWKKNREALKLHQS
ncbi:FGGY-family carbohydrate kinase [Ravibacter arvi]|uniref:FGGY-family carbohydrate kinase n=1 Tax=Ravibacter arvi TaxID=2051041 RepID=A0ABP8LW22_9BACT